MSAESDLILRMIDGFNKIDWDAIVACFADDAIYDNVPMAAVQGTDAIRKTLQGFMGAASEVQWDIVNNVADGGVVLTERVDKFKVNDQWIELRVMGAFEVADGKITAWRDYFDMNQFQTQFAAASG